MTFRLLGMTEEDRLDFEQATGIRTEGALQITQVAVQEAQRMMQTAIREVQGVVGPHGSVTRLQAGGINITPGQGISVFEDGVLKTTVYPDGNFRVGSNVEDPTTTSFCVFVNEQTYNNETMGAGDLLIGDNTAATSNVKYDASEGQLQFRYGQTVNVFVDTDGALKAGNGAVILNEDGIYIPDGGDAIHLVDNTALVHAHLYTQNGSFYILQYDLSSETNILSNGDFESGDFTDWTETDPSGKIDVVELDGNYVARFQDGDTNTHYIEQSVTNSTGVVITFRAKSTESATLSIKGGTVISTPGYVYPTDEWRNYIAIIPAAVTFVRIAASVSAGNYVYIDDVVVRNKTGLTTQTFLKMQGSDNQVYAQSTVFGTSSGLGYKVEVEGDILVRDTIVFEEESSTPSTPGSTGWKLYAKSTGLYLLDDAGTETGILSIDGWHAVSQTWTYASADDPVYQIYVSGDVTANANYKLGNKVKCTNNSTTFYGFIVKVGSYDSGNNRTPVDIYGGTDYDLANSAITAPYISKVKSPDGFPLSPTKWTVTASDTSTRTKTTPTDATWYGETNAMDSSESLPDIAIPIGVWHVTYNALVRGQVPSASSVFVRIESALSTSGNSASDNDLVSAQSMNAGGDAGGNLVVVAALRNFPKVLELTTKTTYYLLVKIDVTASPASLQVQGSIATTTIKAVCAYL